LTTPPLSREESIEVSLARVALPLGLILVVLSSIGCSPTVGQPSSEEILIAEIKPATVYVQYTVEATISTPYYTFTKEGSVVPKEGGVYKRTVSFWGHGTGFIVTPDGYIITNAHVAAKTSEKEKVDLAYYWAYWEFRALRTQYGLSTEQEKILRPALQQYVINHGQWSIIEIDSKLNVWFGAVTTGEEAVAKGYIADLRKAGEPLKAEEVTRDIAIIKVEKKNLPTVKLGDSDEVRAGESVIQVGYPGATGEKFFTEETEHLIPSVTRGIVSALKPTPAGFKAIQHDAEMSHGCSGGPLFNMRGEVVGINTFVAFSTVTGEIVQRFAIPINLAKQFLNEMNVVPRSGELDAHWSRGVNLYYQHRYSDAISEFNRVNELSPGFYYADEFITSAREAIYRGEDIKGFEIGGAFIRDIYMYGIIGIIVVAILVPIFVLKRPLGLKLPMAVKAAPKAKPTPREEAPPVSKDVCAKCGAPIRPGESFCRSCGTKYSK